MDDLNNIPPEVIEAVKRFAALGHRTLFNALTWYYTNVDIKDEEECALVDQALDFLDQNSDIGPLIDKVLAQIQSMPIEALRGYFERFSGGSSTGL
jgi:hypothetical protein